VSGEAEDWAGRGDEPADDETSQADLSAVIEEKVQLIGEKVDLTPEQQEIKRLRDLLAQEKGKKDTELEYEPEAPADGETVRIHFLEDGMTAQGRIWYRGEELEFVVGSPAYQQTFDRFGWSWLSLRDNDFGQVDRWGSVKFRSGPWPGKTYADGKFESLKNLSGDTSVLPPTEEELAAAEKARQRRAAPRLPVVV
jgi:hypothetical protein